MRLRSEPFRLFFPLAVLIAWVGVLPWFLFGQGLSSAWRGTYHALTMTQGFLMALVVGFLGTLLPRRAQAAPLSWLEMGILAVGIVAVPCGSWVGSLAVAECGFLVDIATLAQFAVRAFRVRREGTAPRPAHASMILAAVGGVHGVVGAGLLITFDGGLVEAWALSLGRHLVQQGFLFGLVMAIVPMLAPPLTLGEPAPEPDRRRARVLRLRYAGAGLALFASFLLEEWVSQRAGLLLRALVLALVLIPGGHLFASASRPGLHRRWFRLALWLLPLGLYGAGVFPALRVPLLHLSFVGGLALLAFAVSVHVTLMHTGRERMAEGRPAPVAMVGALILGAAVVRASAERFPHRYFTFLTVAATLWLAAALLWVVFLAPMMRKWPRA